MDANYAVVAEFEADPPDNDPPEPDPMEWAAGGEPEALGSTSITMTAATANDVSGPVYYYFECTTDSEANSPTWQTDANYTAIGLTPSTQYTFKVKARDDSPAQNETAWSSPASATTEEAPTNVEILGDWETGTSHAEEAGYNRALIFVAHVEDDDGVIDPTSVKYGGQTMTKVIDEQLESGGAGWRAYVVAYILNEAGIDAATNNNFVVDWAGNSPDFSAYSSVFLQYVDQADSIGASDSDSTTSSATLTTSALSTAEGDMVLVAATSGNEGSYAVNNGFTEGNDQQFGDTATGVTGHKSATGVPETPSVTYSPSLNRQVIIGFVVQAITAADEPPATPNNLTADAGNELVLLDWDDNSESDLAGYNVYRSMSQGGGTGGYDKINGSLVADSNYVDNDVNNFTPYYYVVKAVDANGHESGYSNEDSAVPAYQTCDDVQAAEAGLVSDLTGNCYVNLGDLEVLIGYWLNTNCSASGNCGGADLEPDGDVDLIDFSDFAVNWMECDNPEDANCPQSWWPTE
jgi:hypothetical protein